LRTAKALRSRADSGTLFLDKVAEMDIGVQSKLLRFLQEKTVQWVGEDQLRRADARIVCATNRDPLAEVSAGRFREDLFYRLHVVPLELPPLREPNGDVLLIANHFLATFRACRPGDGCSACAPSRAPVARCL
jgi:two-component system repressor protein LuxO